METKEFKVQIPEGYEIDKENSTFEYIKFKPIKMYITYKDICKYIFNWRYYYTDSCGCIKCNTTINIENINNSTNAKQLERLLALNQLLNIAEYYNKQHPRLDKHPYCIIFDKKDGYKKCYYNLDCTLFGLVALFNQAEDAQAVIDNPNFKNILDAVYKI